MNSETPACASATDPATTLAALQHACEDRALPASIRLLLQQAHDALQAAFSASEAEHSRYRALFDAVPDPISVIAWDGTVLDLNPASMAAYQRPRDQIVGKPIHVLNPDLPRDHMTPVRDALRRGKSYVVDVTNMRADGTRFPVEVHSANFEYDGQACVLAVARDLSGREEVELRYRELLERIDKGIIVRDANRRITYANAAAIRLARVEEGLTMDEEMRPGRWQIFNEHGREITTADLPSSRTLQTGEIAASVVLGYYNIRLRQLTWVSVTTVPQYAAGSDRPDHVVSMFSDVTALKRDSNLFEQVQELAHIGGWEWDAGRDHLHLTAESERALGRDPAPSTMPALQACLLEPEQRRLQAALQRALEHGDAFDMDLQGIANDGHSFWLRMIGAAEADDPIGSRVAGTLQDITQRKQAEETLRVQARSDPLTRLLNRDAILEELGARLGDRSQASVAVLYIDLDRFKVVNDVKGHAAGDDVLVLAAKRISQAVGTEGLIARFGGDEFLVVCNIGDDSGRPERLAGNILDAFGDSFRFDKEEFSVTASIGIARAPDDGDQPQQLIQNADTAMYDSKRRIRNGWQAFTPALAQSQRDRLKMETHLRRAVDNNEFHLVYQPQVDLRDGRTVAAEALIRWENPALGEMRPDHFISHAEGSGDIVRIGSWVLREACRQTSVWRDAGLGIVRVAVNVSYRQFVGDDLADTVQGLLREFDLPGAALELEFTERVLIEDAPDTLKTFADLRALGVTLTIDDFGEGYSALNYLRRLPIHGLKLSQLFMGGVPGNKSDIAVCQAVAGIASSLGLGLVAEGIESEAQRQFLLGLGVPVGQGFLFAPGLLPDEFAQRLAQHATRLRH